jgi:methyl coenzyme M reductase subunit D
MLKIRFLNALIKEHRAKTITKKKIFWKILKKDDTTYKLLKEIYKCSTFCRKYDNNN